MLYISKYSYLVGEIKMKFNKSHNAIFSLTFHLIIVTKYRKKLLTKELLDELKEICASIIYNDGCELLEFNGEENHIHLLIETKPNITLSKLIGAIKTATARRINKRHGRKYRHFWSPSYFIISCGNVNLETLKKYINNQNCPP